MQYNRLKPFSARSENDDQPLRQSTQIAQRLPTQCDNVNPFPISCDEDDTLLQGNWRIHRRAREPLYDMWVDNQIVGDMREIFADIPLIFVPMPEISIGDLQAANEIEPEQETAIDAIEEQPVIIADEPNNIDDVEQSRCPRRTRKPVDRMGLRSF